MFELISQRLSRYFVPLLMVLVLIGVLFNALLFRQNGNLKAQLQAQQTEMALIQADNRNLANQLENSQIQLEAYQQQVERLNNRVLATMKQAEQRSNEILNELEKHKTWADTAVPDAVGKLLKQRRALQNDNANPDSLPETHRLPNARATH